MESYDHRPVAKLSKAVQDRFAYIDADSDVQRLDHKLKQARTAVERCEHSARVALRLIPTLVLAADQLNNQKWKLECIAEDIDTQLEQLTGDNSESWFHTWDEAYEHVHEAALEQCRKVAAVYDELQRLRDHAEQTCSDWLTARKVAAERFNATHTEEE